MENKLVIISCSDWHKAVLNDEVISSGHRLDDVLINVLNALGVTPEFKEISDEEMEEDPL